MNRRTNSIKDKFLSNPSGNSYALKSQIKQNKGRRGNQKTNKNRRIHGKHASNAHLNIRVLDSRSKDSIGNAVIFYSQMQNWVDTLLAGLEGVAISIYTDITSVTPYKRIYQLLIPKY